MGKNKLATAQAKLAIGISRGVVGMNLVLWDNVFLSVDSCSLGHV